MVVEEIITSQAQKSSIAVEVIDVTRLKNNDEMRVSKDRFKWQELQRQLNVTQKEPCWNKALSNK